MNFLYVNFSYVNFTYVIILAFLAGIAKAGRDTITHHWDRSIFFRIDSDFWRNWFLSFWQDKPSHPIWFLWDGWHFFDTLEKVCYLWIVLLTATKPIIFPMAGIWYIAIIAGMVMIGFNLFYHWIFLTRRHEGKR